MVINNYYKTRWNTKDVSNCITYHIFTIRINYQTKNVVRHKKQKLNIIDKVIIVIICVFIVVTPKSLH